MQVLRSFSNLPFQVSFHAIHEKFINELSDIQRHRKNAKVAQFKCLLNPEGVEHFQQEQYPSMKLVHEIESTYIVGWYEPNEIDFIIKHLVILENIYKSSSLSF
ncbi:hypothetical protein ACQKP0_03685 [Heyndrickxia sp. NPDC080065]|uniref:hypothetical protein n=1 Tax=Heyndrickxia sp. NPDC080065 TaxID=3390568 RepID=UPI003D044AFC